MPTCIFVVDSSPAVRRMVEQISTPEGFEVVGFQDGPAALEAAKRLRPQLIIADYHLDNMTFSGFCKEVNKLDYLSETLIVSLISPADRLDEQHLRTLGVKAFLKKPFQSEHLLDVIKSLPTNGHQSGTNGTIGKRRNWPPETTSTDTEGLEAVSDIADDDSLSDQLEEGLALDQPGSTAIPTAPPNNPASPVAAGIGTHTDVPGEAVGGLFDKLMQSLTVRADQKITELLPDVISRTLLPQLASLVEEHVMKQQSMPLSLERLATQLHDFVQQELPPMLSHELARQESRIRQLVDDTVTPLVKSLVESAVRQQLSEVVREQLGSIELLVKEQIQRAASSQAQEVTAGVVREVAQERIDQMVRQLVPEIAEAQVKEEIKKLSSD